VRRRAREAVAPPPPFLDMGRQSLQNASPFYEQKCDKIAPIKMHYKKCAKLQVRRGFAQTCYLVGRGNFPRTLPPLGPSGLAIQPCGPHYFSALQASPLAPPPNFSNPSAATDVTSR